MDPDLIVLPRSYVARQNFLLPPSPSVAHVDGRMARRQNKLNQQGENAVLPASSQDFDRRALDALKRGARREALDALMLGYGDALFRYCYSMLQSRTLTQDVHQTVFLQAYQDLDLFSGDSFRPWLYAIAHNRCLDSLKVTRRWWKRFFLTNDLPDKPDPSPSSEERLIAGSVASELEKCLSELGAHVRIAVILRYQEGFSYEEMGHICRERPDALKMRVARAMPVLRKCLEAKGVLR